jgi:hypothetical protein
MTKVLIVGGGIAGLSAAWARSAGTGAPSKSSSRALFPTRRRAPTTDYLVELRGSKPRCPRERLPQQPESLSL